MKAKDLLNYLLSLPAESLEQEVVLECLDNLYLLENKFGAAEENFYWNADTGMIPETEVNKQIAEQDPEFPITLADFEIIYPKGTVFISAMRPEGAKGITEIHSERLDALEDRMQELTELYDQTDNSFAQGGIPHLRLERE